MLKAALLFVGAVLLKIKILKFIINFIKKKVDSILFII